MKQESRTVEIRLETDPERMGPGRLVGTLMPYETRAQDRDEMFAKGSLHWPGGGILLRSMHRRDSPIARFTPEATDGEVRVAIQLPDTTAGRDAATSVRAGVLKGLSVEFKSERERQVDGVRVIERAALVGAGPGGSRELCRGNGGSSGQDRKEKVMAVTLTDEEIREQIRVVDYFDHMPLRPGIVKPRTLTDGFWTTKIEAAKLLIEHYAPTAPSSIQNEACLRCVGYLFDRFTARDSVSREGYSDSQAPGQISALRHSGGMALLSPWKRRRGGAI